MKTTRGWWWTSTRDHPILPPTTAAARQTRPLPLLSKRAPSRFTLLLLSLAAIFLVTASSYYYYHLRHRPRTTVLLPAAPCSVFAQRGCAATYDANRVVTAKVFTDEETAARAVIRDILNTPPPPSNSPKIAFMFLTPSSLPFETLWERFFEGHEDKFSVYVHSSRDKPVHDSRYFVGREIRSGKVEWGRISMVDAERRLLAHALLDPENHQFVLLSESCVPLRSFDYVYHHLMFTNVSYIDSYVDPGPHGNGRYSDRMMPEVRYSDFRKGAQWFSTKRQHAIIVMADSLYYKKFRFYCRPNMEGKKNCYSDEHYLQTFFTMIDPEGIAKWSVTHVDWSEGKWHPRSYRAADVTYKLLKNLTTIDEAIHATSEAKKVTTWRPCLWNGVKRPCYLFARKFNPDTMDKLLYYFSNYTIG